MYPAISFVFPVGEKTKIKDFPSSRFSTSGSLTTVFSVVSTSFVSSRVTELFTPHPANKQLPNKKRVKSQIFYGFVKKIKIDSDYGKVLILQREIESLFMSLFYLNFIFLFLRLD